MLVGFCLIKMTDWWIKYEGHIACISHKFPESNFISIKSVHGFPLATYRFHHPSPKALILLFHGMHMSSSDFTHLAQSFHENQFAVAAYDQEGHGNSGGEKGTITSLEDYSEDCLNFIIKTKALYPANTPVILLGLSMGGTMCVMSCLKRPDLIKGIIMFGPALAVDPNFEPLLQKVVRGLNNCCCRKLRIKAIDQELVSRNPYYKGYYEENPEFFHGKLNVRTACAMLDGLGRLHGRFKEFENPVLVFHGEMDKVASFQQAKEFIRDCKSRDKEMVEYKEMHHIITHEPEYNEILAKCLDWVQRLIS